MTVFAPAAIALATSPEYLIPPSATRVAFTEASALAQSAIAVICGTPTPATTRVVQIEPGPMPTLTASAPAFDSASAPSPVATLPAPFRTFLASTPTALIRVSVPSIFPSHPHPYRISPICNDQHFYFTFSDR